jgi:hypothetical protein
VSTCSVLANSGCSSSIHCSRTSFPSETKGSKMFKRSLYTKRITNSHVTKVCVVRLNLCRTTRIETVLIVSYDLILCRITSFFV